MLRRPVESSKNEGAIVSRGLVTIAVIAAALAGCVRSASTAKAPDASWEYVVDAPSGAAHVVHVEATFRAVGTPRLVIDDDANDDVTALEVNDGKSAAWTTPSRSAGAWIVPQCVFGCTVRYAIDLDALAARCEDELDCATRVGPAILSPALAWLIHPQPKGDAPVTLRVRAPSPALFATGLRASNVPGTYRFRSPELDEGSFTAFGPMRRIAIDVAAAHVDVVVLGRSLAMSDDAVAQWIRDSAQCVSTLYGRFPVDRVTVFIVPVHDADEVVFGKVLALAGASVVLITGDAMKAARAREEWVVVHELFHLGFPSFRGEGRWLGEGLATYYEPILRARSGWIDERRMWSDFVRQMPRGLPRPGASAGLADREDLDAVYWGGALFALMSDVEIRARTKNAHSLDDVVRASLARGGDATRVWTVADVVRVGDDVTGTSVLREMYAQHAARGAPIDLDALLASLGVERSRPGTDKGGGVILHDDAPLAFVRRAITSSASVR